MPSTTSLSIAYIRKLQKIFVYFQKDGGNNRPDGCSLVQLIDDDDISTWFIQLKYKDDNSNDFYVSLRMCFSEDGDSSHPHTTGETERGIAAEAADDAEEHSDKESIRSVHDTMEEGEEAEGRGEAEAKGDEDAAVATSLGIEKDTKAPRHSLPRVTLHVREKGTVELPRSDGSPLGDAVATHPRHGKTLSTSSFGTADPSLDGELFTDDAEEPGEEEENGRALPMHKEASSSAVCEAVVSSAAATPTTMLADPTLPSGFHTRLPLVFVIAPRLASSFIHHGAICSLELMSQQWELTAENVAMLIRSLYETLNPFEGDGRVVVAEESAGSSQPSRNAYTEEEHRYGVAHIHKAHPHLFRSYTQQHAAEGGPVGPVAGQTSVAPTAEENDHSSDNSEGGVEEYLLASSSCSSSSHNSLYYCGGRCGFSSDDEGDGDYPHTSEDVTAGGLLSLPHMYTRGSLCPPPTTSTQSCSIVPAVSLVPEGEEEQEEEEEAFEGREDPLLLPPLEEGYHPTQERLAGYRPRHICTHLHKKSSTGHHHKSKDGGDDGFSNHIRVPVTKQEQLLCVAKELVRYQKVGRKKTRMQQQQHDRSMGTGQVPKPPSKYFFKAKIHTDALLHEQAEKTERKREGKCCVHEQAPQSNNNDNNTDTNTPNSNNNSSSIRKFVQPIISATTQEKQLLYEIVLPSLADLEDENDKAQPSPQQALPTNHSSSNANSNANANDSGAAPATPATRRKEHYVIHISGDASVTEGTQWQRSHGILTRSHHHTSCSPKKLNGDRVAFFFRNRDSSEIIPSVATLPPAHGDRRSAYWKANNMEHVMSLMLDDGEEVPTTSIPANMTLCLSHVYVYGHLQVFGNLILKDCVFVGTMSAEQGANVRILRSEVAIHVEDQLMLPATDRAEEEEGREGDEEDSGGSAESGGRGKPVSSDDGDGKSRSDKGSNKKRSGHRKRRKIKASRREGVLVLDTSRVEILDNTFVYRIRYDHTQQQTISPFTLTRQQALRTAERREERGASGSGSGSGSDPGCPSRLHVPEPPPSVLRRVMRSIILVSNQARLRVVQSRIDPWVGSERTIFAEQGAIVDASQSTFLAGSSSAVGIQGCRAFFEHCLFAGVPSSPTPLLVQDTLRATGLNAELGGLLTVRHCAAQHVYFGFSVIAHSVGHFYDCHAEDTVNGFTVDASTAHLENCSARARHVGVFTLRQAKCVVTDDRGGRFTGRCQALAEAAAQAEQMVEDHFLYYHRDASDAESSTSSASSSSTSSSSSSSTSTEDEEAARRWSAHGAHLGEGETHEEGDKKARSALERLAAHHSNPYRTDLRHALRHISMHRSPAQRERREELLRMVTCSLLCISLSRYDVAEDVAVAGAGAGAEPLADPSSSVGTESSVRPYSSCGWPVVSSDAYRFVATMDAPHFKLSGAAAAASAWGHRTKPRRDSHAPLCEMSSDNYYYHDLRRAQQPCAFCGGRFGLEVNNAQLKARGVSLLQAQDAPIYVYDGSQVELEEMLVLNTGHHIPQTQGCGVKVVRAQLRVRCCLVVDYVFAFAAIQGATVTFEECMALRGVNGFTIDASHCQMLFCGADTNHVGVYALNRAQVKMEGTPHLVGVTSALRTPPRLICGGFPSVLRGGLYGVEAQSCHMTCIGITVLRGSDTGFNAYTGSQLHLDRCLVDLSPEDAAVYVFKKQSPSPQRSLPLSHRPLQKYEAAMAVMAPLLLRESETAFRFEGATATRSSNNGSSSKNNHNSNANHTSSAAAAQPYLTEKRTTSPTESPQSNSGNSHSGSPPSLKSSGVKVWSSSHCVAQHCEVRCTAFGFAAIGPEAVLEGSHCTAKRTANGFTVDSATVELVKCSTNSSHVGICVVSHGQCVVRRGSYTARRHAIEVKGGMLHIEEHVKLYGFTHSGLYVHDGAHLESDPNSVLDIKHIREGGSAATEIHVAPLFPRGRVAPPLGPYLAACEPVELLPVCLLLDRATARVSQAVLGGGARCAVHCLPGAQLYLRNTHLYDFTLLGIRVARQAQLIGCNCGLHATAIAAGMEEPHDHAEAERLALVVQAGGLCRLSLGPDFCAELPPRKREKRVADGHSSAEQGEEGKDNTTTDTDTDTDLTSACPSPSEDYARAKIIMPRGRRQRKRAWWHPINLLLFPFDSSRGALPSSSCPSPGAERTPGGPYAARDFVALGHTYICAAYAPFRLQLHHETAAGLGHSSGGDGGSAPSPFQVALVGRCHVEGTLAVERMMIILQQPQQRYPHLPSEHSHMHVCNGGVLSVSQCVVQWVESSSPLAAAALRAPQEGREALFTCEGKESRLRLRHTFFSPSPAVRDDAHTTTATITTIVARQGGRVRLHCVSSTALTDWPFFAPVPVSEVPRAETHPGTPLRLTLEVRSGAVARCDACAFHHIAAVENGNVNLYRCQLYAAPSGGEACLLSLREGAHACLSHSKLFTSLLCDPRLAIAVETASTLTLHHAHFIGWRAPFIVLASHCTVIADNNSVGTLLLPVGETDAAEAEEEEEEADNGAFLVCEDDSAAVYLDEPYKPTYCRLRETVRHMVLRPSRAKPRSSLAPEEDENEKGPGVADGGRAATQRTQAKKNSPDDVTRVSVIKRVRVRPPPARAVSAHIQQKKSIKGKANVIVVDDGREDEDGEALRSATVPLCTSAAQPTVFIRPSSVPVAPASTHKQCDSLWWVEKEFEAEEEEEAEEEGHSGGVFVSTGHHTSRSVPVWFKDLFVVHIKKIFQSFFG